MVKALLPSGCYDILPPFARAEHVLMHTLLSSFESFSYQQVSPPLIEYTESLLAGRGAALSSQVLRMMDPDFHKVMGIRADITLQIARIAATRLADAPLPLRLSYGGLVLRAKGDAAEGNRQLMQAGIELIGPSSPEADAEVIAVTAQALLRAGVSRFVVDLNMPGVVSELLSTEALDNEALADVMQAIAHKDIAAIGASELEHRNALVALMNAAGDAESALKAISRIALPEGAKAQTQTLAQVAKLLAARLPSDVRITVDVTEARGLEYHTGVTFAFFAVDSAIEIGAGGRYRIEAARATQPATGATLYVNALRSVLPRGMHPPCVFIATPADIGTITALQQQGFATLHALPDYPNDRAKAAELGCTHYFADGALTDL